MTFIIWYLLIGMLVAYWVSKSVDVVQYGSVIIMLPIIWPLYLLILFSLFIIRINRDK